MKCSNKKQVNISEKTENIERFKQISLQNYIYDHYKFEVIESGLNEDYEQFESKMNG